MAIMAQMSGHTPRKRRTPKSHFGCSSAAPGQPKHDPAQENGCIFPVRREISRIGAVDQSANHVLAGIGKKQERASHRQQNEHDPQIGKGSQNIPYPLASLAAPPRHPHKQAAINPGHRRRPQINL
jgi:hypothetical protein